MRPPGARLGGAEVAGRGGTIRVVACYSVPVTAEPWYVPAPRRPHRRRADARRLAPPWRVRGADPSVGAVRAEIAALGPAADQLVIEAAGSDLLVVGTHGHGPLDAWRLGSVAHGVIRHARCPVAVVPDREPDHRETASSSVSTAHRRQPPLSRWACDEADDRDDELLVVHAWDYPYATELGSPTARDLTQVDAALELEAAVRSARERRRRPDEDRLVQGRTAFELIEEARDADLVVVGSRGRGAVRSLLFGSVSQEVSARASCPTVIVRDDER